MARESLENMGFEAKATFHGRENQRGSMSLPFLGPKPGTILFTTPMAYG